MVTKFGTSIIFFVSLFFATEVWARDKIQAYFSNDSINGLMLSDAYETHNMGLVYFKEQYYIKLDLGIVSPDMYVYRNQYREANRSFGELISLEIGQLGNLDDDLRFYTKVKATGEFGVDKLQDFVHSLLSLQQVNGVNRLIRMPAAAWAGIGARREFKFSVLDLQNAKLYFDGFLGSDTARLQAKFIKEFYQPLFTYSISFGGHLVAYDHVISAPPINAKERMFIPEVSFGISYDTGRYSIFVRDSFSLPSIEADSDLYGVLSAGVSYEF